MAKFIAILQIVAAAILGVTALATALNLLLISTRPETISVVNALIGQGLIIVCMIALARVLYRKGLSSLSGANESDDDRS